MANASAKKTAAQNEASLRQLRTRTLAVYALAVALRFLLKRTTKGGLILAASTALPSLAIYRFLVSIGTPRRDARGELISPGDDLEAGGLTEYAWDVVYVTWICQLGSAALGEWFWYLYLVIPVYAVYKLWGFAGPMLGFGGGSRGPALPEEEAAPAQATSKRQDKLKKRADRGDPRVKQVQRNA
ncbi:DUF788-domain-containing protein [Exidia glandulosa HHB12029]|uniref:DUF788-domain-containing protein n=1 Tax=Exidia glandulosa HHB12029 TaxID=1314781 RepID=A0A165QQR2_EXIGL|nr:DUF788-domain-containing protein [Exidia glandulosa HHB12029]